MKTNPPSFLAYLKHPFEYIAGGRAFFIGFIFILLSVVLGSAFNTRFDGLLNVHFVEEATAYQLIQDQLVNFLSLLGVFYIITLMLKSRQTRFIDLSGTLLLAMAPTSIVPLLNLNNIMYDTSMAMLGQPLEIQNLGWLILSTIIILILIIWMVALMFQAYKICTNFKGPKLIVSFIIGLIGASVLSKFIITLNH